jgi:hypothetical protein
LSNQPDALFLELLHKLIAIFGMLLVMQTQDEGKPIKTSTDHKLIIQAIKDAEIARKEEDDARHMSLLQELRRQHFEKMTVLNKIVDALTANNSS